MSIDDDFIQTIIANPDDDAPRLIYADWLEEQGDPRGEFIRIQCELAKMPEDDPRRWDLELRQGRLMRWYGWQWWYQPFEPTADVPRFHRGFPEEFCFDARRLLCRAEILFQHYPLFRRLTMISVDPEDAARLACSPWLYRITWLEMTYCRIGNLGAAELARSPSVSRLQTLILKGCGLRDDAAHAFAKSPFLGVLQRLDLRENEISSAGLQALAKRFGSVVECDCEQH
jgi:uncharacterized protein (TIGR02996 family)